MSGIEAIQCWSEVDGGLVPENFKANMTRNDPSPCRLLLASTNALELLGVRWLFGKESSVKIVGEGRTPSAVLEMTKRERPTALLIDIDDYGFHSLNLIRDILNIDSRINVVLLSSLDNRKLVEEALNLGVAGIVLKVQSAHLLVTKIQELSRKERHSAHHRASVSQAEGVTASSSSADASAQDRIRSLTVREREIIDYLGKGLTNKEIAIRLRISSITVRHHLTRIFSKLGLLNRQQLLLFAHTYQLVTRSSIVEAINRPA